MGRLSTWKVHCDVGKRVSGHDSQRWTRRRRLTEQQRVDFEDRQLLLPSQRQSLEAAAELLRLRTTSIGAVET